MKEGWEYKKLGEVTTKICDGSHNPPKGVEHSEYPMLSSKNIFFDRFDYDSPRYLSEGDFTEENKRTNISDGDVLLTIVGTVGRTCCVTKPFIPFTLQRSVAVLKPQKTIITSRFLMYSLHSLSNIWESEAKGVAQKGVYLKQVSNISIPIPTITEQNDIVCELDLLSGVIEKQKAQLEELDKLAQSIFYDMFGDPVTNEKNWDVKKLSEVSKEKLSYGSGASAIPYDGELRYIRITDIKDNGELNEDVVSPNQIDEKYILREGDILFARSGATVGKTYRHREEYGKCLYAGYLIRLVPNIEMVMPTYVFGYTKTSYYLEFVRNAQNAVAQPNINAKQYGHLLICVPPLSLQQEFAAKVEAIEAMKAKVRQSLKEVETLFNERMDYYFN